MPVNYFLGRSQQQLEADLKAAQDDLAAGKNVQTASSGDVRKEDRIEKSIEARILMILQALNLIDPTAYPNTLITPLRSTRIILSETPPPNTINPDFPVGV